MTSSVCRSVLLCICAFATTLVASGVRAQPEVLITIDVESREDLPLPQQIDAMCDGRQPCGIMEIARLLEARDMAATFFLNVYERNTWGDTPLRELVQRLQAAGHDVELHTHPQWAYDSKRNLMHQYSLVEQTAIVKDGIAALSGWSGLPVVAHRAGAYGADQNTLQALIDNGIQVDSSLFLDHPNSKLQNLGLPWNRAAYWRGLLQVPVTVYRRNELPDFAASYLAPIPSIRKVDADWFVSAQEARDVIAKLATLGVPTIVVFLHSYSLIGEANDDGSLVSDKHTIEIFTAMLDAIKDNGSRVVTMRTFAQDANGRVGAGDDVVPTVPVHVALARYAWHRIAAIEKQNAALAGGIVMLFSAAMYMLHRLRRR